ncbi:SHOCT domain-containing protein [Kocuria rosea]|uniref:SHOCT domain-containing protein n=1 Tax=Kocuria rosea TaxID=1275 RepID=UPI00203A7A81|nr:SHOCT domain-containing protein [Kocuria rosea]MCM3686716.1 SHOCT domain-containing protein [Kocuria rosea]
MPAPEAGKAGAADDVGGIGGTVGVLGLSPFQAWELVVWVLLIAIVGWGAARALVWFVLRYGQDTRWGRRTRTRLGLRRARDDLLDRHARGEITEEEYRERLRILEQEGRAGQ